MLNQLVWEDDRMLLGDLVFRIEHYKNANWELGDNCFTFYKTKPLIDQYEKFLSSRKDFNPQNILELGMWDGGSIAFWFEYFRPRKHVGIDIQKRTDSEYFSRYKTSRNLEGRIRTYWGTDQADAPRLRRIVEQEFAKPLDLVIDDASHMYDLSKASFECLFPILRPGGLYIIEDWAWAHWKEFQTLMHPWALKTELTRLIFELVEATGSAKKIISQISVYDGFVAVERGEVRCEEEEFRLNDWISRRPKIPPIWRLLLKGRKFIKDKIL